MRHTRNRQLIKATGQTGWKEARVLTIEYMRKAVPDLDTTFKWHRELTPKMGNYVEFGEEHLCIGAKVNYKL